MNQLHISASVAIAVFLFYGLYSAVNRRITNSRFRKAHGCLPPKKLPQKDRLFGLDFFFQRLKDAKNSHLLNRAVERFQNTGNTFSFVLMGKTTFSTIEPENLKAILATQFEDFGLGQRLIAWAPFAGAGIFTTDGAYWEHSREMIRPNFSRAQVADLDTFESHVQNLINQISDGETVDLQPLFFRLTLDSATEFLMGESVYSLSRGDLPQEKDFGYQFDYAQTGISRRMRLGPFYWAHRDAKFDYACKFCQDLIDYFVQKALEHRHVKAAGLQGTKADFDSDDNRSKYIFINELAKQTDDPIILRNEAMNILVAGRDTTASLLSNLFVMLAKHPQVWTKLRNEVRELNGKIPDYETLRGMKYLKCILNETLRLYPSVPANFRCALKPTTLPRGGGADGLSPVFIPAGALVSYTVFAMHRRKDIYGPDAESFRPERWESEKGLRPGWGYLPFNGGPRICVGQQFALTEAGYATVRLLQVFDGGLEDRSGGREWAPKQHLTMCSLWGTKVVLRKG